MAEYSIDAEIVQSGESGNMPERMAKAYGVLQECKKKLEKASSDVLSSLPDKIDFCDPIGMFNSLNNVIQTVNSVTVGLTRDLNSAFGGNPENEKGLELSAGCERYYAMEIILKEYQILKYQCEKLNLIVEKWIAEMTKKILIGVFDGEGSMFVTPIQVPLNLLSSFGNIASKAINALSKLLSFLDKMSVMNVKSSGCCFMMTPKSFKKTDIKIRNVNSSLTNNIPNPIDEALTKAEQIVKENTNKIRQNAIQRMKNDGANSAASGELNVGDVGQLPKFDRNAVKTARNAILQALVDADGLPRYEDLSIANVRFLVYLATGFEPAAQKSFGIPGFP